ncbi:uncharacterized protein L3040_002989 [Drepanopeziza brunnea f. sp. 'multigermtubi']|uniref:uncharacterized protein n=1 Tax=Drepanopeziza brunnea f. sp. 'multigermtubi' TaxID=698441 RepID=UPI00239326B5|nr:hypothetical protein L3040_002989 [Drepanopeziza brunnea f. sp. 'multigermtubi']
MRLNTSTPSLFAVSSLFCFVSSLPLVSRRPYLLQPRERRATYSIVPVDGGQQPAAMIVQTIVVTQPPLTFVETDDITLPPITNFVVSTKIFEGPKTTLTILLTATPAPAKPKYSIIDIIPPPTTQCDAISYACYISSICTSINFICAYYLRDFDHTLLRNTFNEMLHFHLGALAIYPDTHSYASEQFILTWWANLEPIAMSNYSLLSLNECAIHTFLNIHCNPELFEH